MLSLDLVLIIGMFGMAGYYYTANQIGAGEWYALQYNVDLLATNIQMAAAIGGPVSMTMSLPPNSYVTVMNNDPVNPTYGMVIGQQVHASRTLEWSFLNTIIEQSGEYNNKGFMFGPLTNGLATLIQYVLTEKTNICHAQFTAPSYGGTIRNTEKSFFGVENPDTATKFYVTLDGSSRANINGYYYNVVSVTASTTPP